MTKTLQIIYDSHKKVWRLPDGTETPWFPSDFIIANENSKKPLDLHFVGANTSQGRTGREGMTGTEYYKKYYVRGTREARREEIKEVVREKRRKRGRPVGSKNKPKVTITITPDLQDETQPLVRKFIVRK